jgi:hypothetical protein
MSFLLVYAEHQYVQVVTGTTSTAAAARQGSTIIVRMKQHLRMEEVIALKGYKTFRHPLLLLPSDRNYILVEW